MCVNLRAHHEWAIRPTDERYPSVEALHQAVIARRAASRSMQVHIKDLVVETDGVDVTLRNRNKSGKVSFSNWSFDQFSRLVGAPAYYLNKLPAHLVTTNLNYGIEAAKNKPVAALVSTADDGAFSLRAALTPRYARIWDDDLIAFAREMTEGTGWQLPKGYKDGRWGAELVPSGAYASDRDVFLFMVDYSRPIEVNGDTFFRGFYLWNSEVGSKTVGMEFFLFRMVCGNNMVHGFQQVGRLTRKHIGKLMAERSLNQLRGVLETYMNAGTKEETAGLLRAMNYVIKDDPADFLRNKGFAKHEAEEAVRLAIAEEGDAKTLFNNVQGLTAYARMNPYQNERTDLEVRAGKLLALAV